MRFAMCVHLFSLALILSLADKLCDIPRERGALEVNALYIQYTSYNMNEARSTCTLTFRAAHIKRGAMYKCLLSYLVCVWKFIPIDGAI